MFILNEQYQVYVFSKSLRTTGMHHKIKLKLKFNRFKIRDFLFLRRLPYKGYIGLPALPLISVSSFHDKVLTAPNITVVSINSPVG